MDIRFLIAAVVISLIALVSTFLIGIKPQDNKYRSTRSFTVLSILYLIVFIGMGIAAYLYF